MKARKIPTTHCHDDLPDNRVLTLPAASGQADFIMGERDANDLHEESRAVACVMYPVSRSILVK